MMVVGGNNDPVAEYFNPVQSVAANYANRNIPSARVLNDASHGGVVDAKVNRNPVSGDAVHPSGGKRLPQALPGQLGGQAGHAPITVMAGHVPPIIRRADRPEVVAPVQGVLIGSATLSGSHKEILAQSYPFFIGFRASVHGEHFSKGGQFFVIHRPVAAPPAGPVPGMVGDDQGILSLQTIVELLQPIHTVDPTSFM